MSKIYEVQDMLDCAYALLDAIGNEVNNLITENEKLKTKYTKKCVEVGLKDLNDKVSAEEQMYLDYYKEFYGKEVM